VRAIGGLLMLSGWLLVLACLVLLPGLAQRAAFVGAGIAVEALGLVVLARSYRRLQLDQEDRG
jgi:low temperature requirement protein LtrA